MPDSLRPHGLLPTRLLCPWDFPGMDTGVHCHFFLQGIFMTQGLNLGLLHCRQILYWLSFQGSPWELFVLIYETTSKVRVVPVFVFFFFVAKLPGYFCKDDLFLLLRIKKTKNRKHRSESSKLKIKFKSNQPLKHPENLPPMIPDFVIRRSVTPAVHKMQ